MTVEDKIGGNMSVQQAGLLGVPVLIGFAIAVFFPPSGQFVAYKMIIVAVLFIVCGTLAVRVKGRILAQWIMLLTRYCTRPQYYVYDKNTSYLRASDTHKAIEPEAAQVVEKVKRTAVNRPKIAQREFARLEEFARDSRSSLKFEVGKRGELHVRVTEAK
jgi:hypothetical protein